VKVFLLAILGLGGILLRLFGWQPWASRRQLHQGSVARFNFLLVTGIVVMSAILLWFWLEMRSH
jgi:hypothetical protein